jgi:uncharacterized protein YaiI (UPF0178 family)
MLTIYVDADACPVKEEVYKVARRYGMHVAVVANAALRVPADALIALVVRPGFGAADDWIAEQAGTGEQSPCPRSERARAHGQRHRFGAGNTQPDG